MTKIGQRANPEDEDRKAPRKTERGDAEDQDGRDAWPRAAWSAAMASNA